MTAEIGLGIQTDKLPGRYAELARVAEAGGVDVLSVFADLLYQPSLPALLEMAAATDRVRLGAACANPYTLHPYEIAGQWVALDLASQGRAYLGVARGSWLDVIGVRQDRGLAHLRDAVGFARALVAGEGYEGEVFRLEASALRTPVFRREIPVLIGSWGAHGMRLAGEVADELKIGGSANPAMVRLARERIGQGESIAGRQPGSVGIVMGAVTVIDRDRAFARRLARTEVAMYLAVVADLDPTVELPGDLVARVRALLADGDAEAAGALIPDDVLDLFAFAGSPEDLAGTAQRLIDAGAHRVEFGTPHGPDPLAAIRLLCGEVVPALRRG